MGPAALLTFGALMAASAICIEASRRLGMPAGIGRDLLSAWWLPVALLLPPVYALLIPSRCRRCCSCAYAAHCYIGVRSSVRPRTRRGRGLASFTSSCPTRARQRQWLTDLDSIIPANDRLRRPVHRDQHGDRGGGGTQLHAGQPLARAPAPRKHLVLDVVELSSVSRHHRLAPSPRRSSSSPLPPVMLLQRSLLHQNSSRPRPTDAKTGC